MLDGVHFYNQTLKKSVAVFGTIFNNLKIVKTGASETRVPLAYGSSALNKGNLKRFDIAGTELSKNTLRQSVPYNLGMQLNIMAKTQDEALQIFEQILPTFVPEYTVAIKDMDGTGNSVDVPIILTGTTFEDDYEGDFSTRRTIVYSLEFQMKIRFTGRVTIKPVIRTITADLYNSSTAKSSQTAIDRVKTELGTVNDTPGNFTTNTTFGFDDA